VENIDYRLEKMGSRYSKIYVYSPLQLPVKVNPLFRGNLPAPMVDICQAG
jgi:hypothetical protein